MLESLLPNRYLWQELVWRDLRSRYLGSILGFFWSILNPLLQLGLYTLVFGSHLGIRFKADGTTGSFAIALFAALLPWTSFQESIARSSDVFIAHSNLLKKVRFPFAVLPLSMVSSALVHQLVGTAVFMVVLTSLGQLSVATLPWLIVLLSVQWLMMMGLASAVACLNVFFRDISQMIGIGFMFLFWMTPIVYSRQGSGELLSSLLRFNPLTYMVEGYRLALLGGPPVDLWGLAYWCGCSILCFWFGWRVMNRLRPHLLDRL